VARAADGSGISLSEPSGYEQRSWWKGALAFHRANEFDLTYMRARWYDPDLGRFVSEDPIGLAGGINKYVFAANNPVNGRDPTGLQGDDNPANCEHVGHGVVICDPTTIGGVTVSAPWTLPRLPLVSIKHSMAWGLIENVSLLTRLAVNRRAFGTPFPSFDPNRYAQRTPQECFDQSTGRAREVVEPWAEAIFGTATVANVVRTIG
jgi:RHS repeat-associated protein